MLLLTLNLMVITMAETCGMYVKLCNVELFYNKIVVFDVFSL